MRLVIIRHGESEWNKLNLFTGWSDVDLSPEGKKEARLAGVALKEEDIDFDVCYTSYLKRAIHTLNLVLEEMHYGALQGLNKAETAKKYGEKQVKIWRRSFSVRPPVLDETSNQNPKKQVQYSGINRDELPLCESLEDTINRVVTYFNNVIKKDMLSGKRVLIVAHGNSIRSLVKYFENLSEEGILEVNIPTGTPLVYEFDDDFGVIEKHYLGDEEEIAKKTNSVLNQGSIKNKEIETV